MKTEILTKIRLHKKENPIYSAQLEKEFDVSGIHLREIIHELRLEGHPIGSGSNGYFYATDKTELKDTIDNLLGREIKIREVRLALEKCFSQDNQLRLI